MRLVTILVAAALALPVGARAAEISEQAIKQLADARATIEQQAPTAYARIVDGPGFPDLPSDERNQVERALAPLGLSFDQYAQLERDVRQNEDAKRRLAALEAASGSHGGGAPGTDGTRNTPPGLSGSVPAPTAPGRAELPAHQSYQGQQKENESQK